MRFSFNLLSSQLSLRGKRVTVSSFAQLFVADGAEEVVAVIYVSLASRKFFACYLKAPALAFFLSFSFHFTSPFSMLCILISTFSLTVLAASALSAL